MPMVGRKRQGGEGMQIKGNTYTTRVGSCKGQWWQPSMNWGAWSPPNFTLEIDNKRIPRSSRVLRLLEGQLPAGEQSSLRPHWAQSSLLSHQERPILIVLHNTALKNILCSACSSIPPPSSWPYCCLHSSAFSRMSYSYNYTGSYSHIFRLPSFNSYYACKFLPCFFSWLDTSFFYLWRIFHCLIYHSPCTH